MDENVITFQETCSRILKDLKWLLGEDYESYVSTYVHRFLRRNLGINATVFSDQRTKSDLTKLLDKAEKEKIILAQETDELDKADLVLTSDGPTDYILAEISITVQQDDIDRAAERAGLLAKATARTVTPFAIGTTEEADPSQGTRPDPPHPRAPTTPNPQDEVIALLEIKIERVIFLHQLTGPCGLKYAPQAKKAAFRVVPAELTAQT